MPPRKKPRHVLVKEAFLASLPDPLPSDPASLTLEQLKAAYGFQHSEWPRCCHAPREFAHVAVKGKGKARAIEVLTLDTDDDTDDNAASTSKQAARRRSTRSGSGEAAAIDGSEEEEAQNVPAKRRAKANGNGADGGEGSSGSRKKASGSNGKGKHKEPCSSDACASNPLCCNWLGQEKWEDDDKALKAFRKARGFSALDPSNGKEDPDIPVGLRNLGATCYVNSFLQVWYQDLTFRAGVYSCLPPASGNVEASPLFQLQVLFAFLQTSAQGVYNPEPLVNALGLDSKEQQDAQEFSKLFLSLLDFEFKKQSLNSEGGIGQLVENQKNCRLGDRIEESLTEEHMEGDNQYACETCNSKQDAIRFSNIKSLPPVLHFSLLRFVFSTKDYSRSKSQHAISYPLKLDMGEYLPAENDNLLLPRGGTGAKGVGPPSANKKKKSMYGLKGVLMHKGSSAHHGHYVAQVHDAVKNKWFLFDDEAVSAIDDLNAPSQYDDPAAEDEEDEEVKSSKKVTASKKKEKELPKAKKPGVGFKLDGNGGIIPNSKDAYMLVYHRLPDEEDLKSALVEPEAPPLALARVEELDQIQHVEAEAFRAEESGFRTQFESLREKKRSVYQHLQPVESEETYLVSKAGLKQWIDDGLVAPKKDKGKGKASSSSPTVDRGSVAPTSTNGNGDAQKDGSDIEMLNGSELKDDIDVTKADLDATMHDGSEIGEEDPLLLDATDLLCVHGAGVVDPQDIDKTKVISKRSFDAMGALGIKLLPELPMSTALCRTCVWDLIADQAYHNSHEEHLSLFMPAYDAPADEDTDVWISAAWVTDWKKPSPKMHVAGASSDPPPSAEPFHSDVYCPHGKLQPAHKKRRSITVESAVILQSIFPEWEPAPYNLANCNRCDRQNEATQADQKALAAKMKDEKAVLKSFTSQMTLTGSFSPTILPGVEYFAVNREFKTAWLAWTKAKSPGPRPEGINNNLLICTRHGRSLFSIEDEVAHPMKVDIVSAKEWKMLVATYNVKPQIKVFESDGHYKSVPIACEDCLDAERMSFATTQIKIRTLTAQDVNLDGSRRVDGTDDAAAPETKHKATYGSSFSGTRSSKRIASAPALKAVRGLKTLEVERTDTVKDIKVKIDARFEITPIYQRLFYLGRPLENEETVASLGLSSGKMIELFEEKPEEDDVDFSTLDDVVPSRGRKHASAPEQGFSGTGLAGWEGVAANDGEREVDGIASGSGSASRTRSGSEGKSASRSASAPADEIEGGREMKACTVCTFLNEVGEEKCQICGCEF